MTLTRRSWWLGIPGAILIGALGSGLWDMAVKPSGQWFVRAILNIVTFGSASIKDHIYREAAKGMHEGASMFLLGIPIAFILVMPLVGAAAIMILRMRYRNLLLNKQLLLNKPRPNFLERQKRINLLFTLYYSLYAILFIPISFLVVEALEISQANATYTFFSQSIAICRPYMDEKELQVMLSRFAAVRTRADFMSIADDLHRIARSKQQSLPDYEPW